MVTAPERFIDMASGEMERQLEETGEYKLDFDSSKMWQHRPDAAPPGRL